MLREARWMPSATPRAMASRYHADFMRLRSPVLLTNPPSTRMEGMVQWRMT